MITRTIACSRGWSSASGRAICLASTEALERYGAPEEVLTDNGKQFTARFGRGGEVLFDKICRRNAIVHRLPKPSSPTTTGKDRALPPDAAPRAARPGAPVQVAPGAAS